MRQGVQKINLLQEGGEQPLSTVNVLTLLRNELDSLVLIAGDLGFPDPLTLVEYEAKIVETLSRTDTPAPTYGSNLSQNPSPRERSGKTPCVCWP